MNYLAGLNGAQRKAVEHTDGPLLIIAGAGAGKTKVITTRILHLMKSGIAPEKILAITFTNKAAKEMRERVFSLIKEETEFERDMQTQRPFISTFHSLGVLIIKENAERLGLTRFFTIFDRDDSKRAIKEALQRLGADPKQYEPGKILSIISRRKGEGDTPSSFNEKARGNMFNELVVRVWEHYEAKLLKEKSLDFDDLLLKSLHLLKKEPALLDYYRNRWSHIHIDEFQDTNNVQYELSELLAQKHQNICVVGDMDQNIYSWRGANMKHIFDFENDFKDVCTILLEENYRSTKKIISAANTVIANNTVRKEKNLYTQGPEGDDITLYTAYDENDEARYIAETAKSYILDGTEPDEIAVLYRTNFQSRAIEQAFIDAGVSHQVLGTRFFDRKEVKDILTFLRLSLNPDNSTDLARVINVPPRGIGKVTLMRILSDKEDELTPAMRERVATFRKLLENIKTVALNEKPSETITYILKKSGIEDLLSQGTEEERERLANAQELVTLAQKYDAFEGEEGVLKLLEDASLASEQDSLDQGNKGGVKLLTIHASKGLEFDTVFIAGLEDGLFPSMRSSEAPKKEDREEERRLFYVALTRARKKLFLTHAMMRTIYGSRNGTMPSEFLSEIEEEALEQDSSSGEPIKTVYLDF